MKPWLRAAALAAAAAIHLAQSGCARAVRWPDLPPPPTEDIRRRIGTVSIRAVEAPFDARFAPPIANTGQSVCFYSFQGAAVGLLIGGAFFDSLTKGADGGGPYGACIFIFLLFVGVAVALALIPVGGFFGAVYGLAAGPDGEEIEQGMATLRAAAADVRFAARIRDRILGSASARAGVRLASDESADAILEVGPPAAAFIGPWKVDPPLDLVGALPARLVKASDGSLLWSATLAFQGPRAPFVAWAADGGRALTAGLEQAVDPIADRILDETFVLYLLPEDRKLEERRR